jgi:hypothetical protein
MQHWSLKASEPLLAAEILPYKSSFKILGQVMDNYILIPVTDKNNDILERP